MKFLIIFFSLALSGSSFGSSIDEDVQLELIKAARANNLSKVKNLVENFNADVNYKFSYDTPRPLSHAAVVCHHKVVDYLISKGANKDYRQLEEKAPPLTKFYHDHLWSPLHYAAHTSHFFPHKCIKTIQVLLKQNALIAQLNNNGETPAFRTFFKNYRFELNTENFNFEAFRILIEEDPFISETINTIAIPNFIKHFFEPYTLLSLSLKLGFNKASELLFNYGALPISKKPNDPYDWKIQYLCYVTSPKDFLVADKLLALDANVNEHCKKQSEKIILTATREKNLKLVEALVLKGAELTNLKVNSKTNLLFRAIDLEAFDIAKFLIASQPSLINPDKKLKVWSHQPLIIASQKGPIEIFDQLWQKTKDKDEYLDHYLTYASNRIGGDLLHILKVIINSTTQSLRFDIKPIIKAGAYDNATLAALDFVLTKTKVEVNSSLQEAVVQSQDRTKILSKLLSHSSLKKNTIFTATAYKAAIDKEYFNVIQILKQAGIDCKYRSHLLGRSPETIDLCL